MQAPGAAASKPFKNKPRLTVSIQLAAEVEEGTKTPGTKGHGTAYPVTPGLGASGWGKAGKDAAGGGGWGTPGSRGRAAGRASMFSAAAIAATPGGGSFRRRDEDEDEDTAPAVAKGGVSNRGGPRASRAASIMVGVGAGVRAGAAAPAARLKVWQDVAAVRHQGNAAVVPGSPRNGGGDQEVQQQAQQGAGSARTGSSKSNLKSQGAGGNNGGSSSRLQASVRFQITPRSRESSMIAPGAVNLPQQHKRRGFQHWQPASNDGGGSSGASTGFRRQGPSSSISQQHLQHPAGDAAVIGRNRHSRGSMFVPARHAEARERPSAFQIGSCPDDEDSSADDGPALQQGYSSSSRPLSGGSSLRGGEGPLGRAESGGEMEGPDAAAAAGAGSTAPAAGCRGRKRKQRGPATAGSKAMGNTRGAAKYLAQLPASATAVNLSALGESTNTYRHCTDMIIMRLFSYYSSGPVHFRVQRAFNNHPGICNRAFSYRFIKAASICERLDVLPKCSQRVFC